MVTLLIIAVTVVVSILCFNNEILFERLAFSAYRTVKFREWYRLVSHGLVHADWVHLFVNMFTFYSFGTYIEQVFMHLGFGRGTYLLLYFGGMVVASLYDLVTRKNDPYYRSVGASGAVSAVLFAFILFNPWDKILLFAIVPIPGILFGLFYLFYCQYMARQGGGHINHNAHFYGAVYGFLFPILIKPSLFLYFIQELIGK